VKYMLMFLSDAERDKAMDPQEVTRGYQACGRWWNEHERAGRIVEGHQLKLPDTATTVRHRDGKIVVTDGPFVEAKESLGGYAIINVADLDAALAMAKTWPWHDSVEVRPLVEARDEDNVPRER
jgi:hypothetical protein